MGSSKPRCPHCGVYVKPENLPTHLRNVHRDESGAEREAARVRESAPTRPRRATPVRLSRGTWAAIGVVLLIIVAGVAIARFATLSPYGPNTPVTEMCIQHTSLVRHDHARLTINYLGSPMAIPGSNTPGYPPADVGITPECMRPVHTHDETGTIHIESPVPHDFTLRDFFIVWGQPFSSSRILGYTADATHRITMTVDGAPSSAYENLVLQNGQNIAIDYEQV